MDHGEARDVTYEMLATVQWLLMAGRNARLERIEAYLIERMVRDG